MSIRNNRNFDVALVGMGAAAIVAACSSFIPSAEARLAECQVTLIADLLKNPVKSHNKTFCGYVYLYEGERFYAFLPKPITGPSLPATDDPVLLLGRSSDPSGLASLERHKTGDRVFVRGRLRVEPSCFRAATCVPWPKPIYLEQFELSE
jgi:hypothetical protein